MFSNTYQSGLVSIFFSCGSNPLSIWDKQVKNGHIRRVVDEEVKSLVLEISGTNVSTTYITCPNKRRVSLGIRLPFLVMIIKNLKKYFTFEIQILDDKGMHRRFRVSNFQSTTRVHPFCTTMPIGLSNGWNQVQFNLADFTKRAYGTCYQETTRVQIHANIRIRRIYFSDRLYSDEEMPNEFKLFVPMAGSDSKYKPGVKQKKDEAKPEEKKPSAVPGEEIPSGAPPTPAEMQSPAGAPSELSPVPGEGAEAAPPTEEEMASTDAEAGSPMPPTEEGGDATADTESPGGEQTPLPSPDVPTEEGAPTTADETAPATETTTEAQPSPATESSPESPEPPSETTAETPATDAPTE